MGILKVNKHKNIFNILFINYKRAPVRCHNKLKEITKEQTDRLRML